MAASSSHSSSEGRAAPATPAVSLIAGYEPARSADGWVLFVSDLHEDATEDDLVDAFAEYGDVHSIKISSGTRTAASSVRI